MGLTDQPEVSYEEPSINEKETVNQGSTVEDIPVVVLKGRERNTSDFGTSINILKSYLGSGILGLPYAFREGGVTGSLLIMIFIGIISSHAMYLLVKTKQKLNKNDVPVVSFGDIAQHCYGKIGLYLVNGMLMFTQFGFCCVYVVYVSSNLQDLLAPKVEIEFYYIALAFIPVFVILSWIRTMKVLSIISACAVFAILMSLIIIVIASTETIVDIVKDDNSHFTVNWGVEWKTILIMMGMAIYAFEGIGLVIPCEAAIKNQSHYNPVLIVSLTIASLNYIFIGFIAYVAFGDSTCDIITHNLQTFADTKPNDVWNILTIIVTLALIITISGTFPLQLFVVTDIIEEYAFRPGKLSTKYRFHKENLIRLTLVLLATIVGISIPDFSSLLSLIGSLGSSSLQFIFPALFYLKVNWKTTNIFFKAILFFYIFFGFAAGILGTGQTLLQLIQGDTAPC